MMIQKMTRSILVGICRTYPESAALQNFANELALKAQWATTTNDEIERADLLIEQAERFRDIDSLADDHAAARYEFDGESAYGRDD